MEEVQETQDKAEAERMATTALDEVDRVRAAFQKDLKVFRTDDLFHCRPEGMLYLERGRARKSLRNEGAAAELTEAMKILRLTGSDPSAARYQTFDASVFEDRAECYEQRFAATNSVDFLDKAIQDIRSAHEILLTLQEDTTPVCRRAALYTTMKKVGTEASRPDYSVDKKKNMCKEFAGLRLLECTHCGKTRDGTADLRPCIACKHEWFCNVACMERARHKFSCQGLRRENVPAPPLLLHDNLRANFQSPFRVESMASPWETPFSCLSRIQPPIECLIACRTAMFSFFPRKSRSLTSWRKSLVRRFLLNRPIDR